MRDGAQAKRQRVDRVVPEAECVDSKIQMVSGKRNGKDGHDKGSNQQRAVKAPQDRVKDGRTHSNRSNLAEMPTCCSIAFGKWGGLQNHSRTQEKFADDFEFVCFGVLDQEDLARCNAPPGQSRDIDLMRDEQNLFAGL